ncbi:TonB-dependent receptor [Pedobacter sp. BS3]|nr:TonB-dependent receptor [Pedobacter sp. BS3]
MMLCSSLLLLFLSISPHQSRAQTLRTIKGIVVDEETKQPLPGATIKVRGTNRVVSTNANGAYSIQAVSHDILEVRYLGYQAKTISVAGSNTLNISLTPDAQALKEVIVVGYGTTTRADLTGSVAQVKVEDMNKAPVGSFEESLAGRVAGINVSATDGQPGQALNIVIRGNNSLTQSNSPLYVIDGFPVEDPDNAAINPDDIESMNILKDASATAIYGARGANGVVIIETKKGKVGAPVVTFNNSFGFQQVQKTIPVMSPYDFVKYEIELSSTYKAIYTPADISPTDSRYDPNGRTLDDYKNIAAINWQDQIFRNSLNRIHNLAIRGGTAQTKYAISASAYSQDGIIINTGYDKYQGRVNVDQVISKKLKAGINANMTKQTSFGSVVAEGEGSSYTTYLLSRAWGFRPVTSSDSVNLLDEDMDEESLTQYYAAFNPVVTSNNAYNKKFTTNFLTNAYIQYDINRNLQLKMSGTVSTYNRRSENFYNSKTPQGSLISYFNSRGINASVGYNERTILSNENILTYTKTFNKVHKLTAMGGVSFQGSKYNAYGYANQQIPNENLGMSGIDQGTTYSSSALLSEYSLFSGYTRINYGYKSKYLLTATMRADASSKFSKENRWGYFPSISAAWNMQEEPWLKNLDFISESKLRLSYGLTGNNRVGEYDRFPSLTLPFSASYSWNNSTPVLGAIVSDLGNADLKWETTEQIDLGWDFGLFKDRIGLTVDLYRKNTRDLLLRAQLPNSTGFTSAIKNIGSVRNDGLELTLNTVNIKSKNFSWLSNFNISFNRNKVLALTDGQDKLFVTPSFESQYNANPLYISEIGRPMGMIYGYIWDGVYTYDDFDNPSPGVYNLKKNVSDNGTGNVQPGDIKYRDLNNDGTIDPHDLTIIGRGLPVHSGGFNNNLNYKAFSLNIFFQWSYGNDIYNANRLMFDGNGNPRGGLNQYATYANRWSPDNPNSTLFRTGGQGVVGYHSSRVLEDGSYLRLKTVSLGYDLPQKYIKHLSLNKLNLSVAAQNLVTWTNYSGMDPEVSVRNTNLTPGFDFSAYPIPRTVVVALKATF